LFYPYFTGTNPDNPMKKCLKCGHGNSPEAKYCANCGNKLSFNCPQCGTENNPEARFCQECGSKIAVAETGSDDPSKPKKQRKEAERRQLTILFCDLVGSTPLSEQLDPEEYRQVITGYHQVAEKVITRNGGHVAQYLGDGLLVYFGYPRGLEDAPRAAVRTGLGILETMAEANKKWEAAGRTPVNVRIGIHTGLVVVDDHLALGEAVNVAARLEGLAPQNGMVISPQTYKLTYGWFEVKSIGKHTLKGITEPMEIYQVLHESGAITRLDVAKRRGLSPLVGRKNELDILMDLWEKAKDGKSHIVLVHGEAGIGKSRLVDTLEENVYMDTGTHIAIASGSSYQNNSAFYPIKGMFEEYVFQYTESDSPESKIKKLEEYLRDSDLEFKSSMSLMAEFLSIPSENFPPLVISPFAKRLKTMECISQILLSLAKHKPLLFIVEDLHWIDASTLEWLNQFSDKIEGEHILTLCTTRPGFKADWKGRAHFTRIDLHRLSSENSNAICHHQTSGKQLPEEILRQIAAKTEGVPLFVEELTKTILESGILMEKDDAFEIAGPVSSLTIPSTLQDSLLARLDRLDEVKEIVQVGSVIGREFSADILNAVLPQNRENLEQSLYKLIDSEILHQSGPENQKVYQFKHALIQDTAYESLLKSNRQKMHQKVAIVLESQFDALVGSQPELLAHHYTQANEPVKAIPLWLKAGQMASQKNAALEAIAHLEKGLDLLHHLENEADRNNLELDFLLTLGGTYVVSHGFPHPKVKETFDQAREIAQKTEVNPKLALILLNLLSYYMNTEDYKSMKEIADYSRTLAMDPDKGYWFELVVNQLGDGAMIKGEFEEAKKGFSRVIELFDTDLPFPWELAPSGHIQIGAKAWLMVCLQIMGYMDQAKNLFDQHLSYAQDHKDSMTLYHIYTFPALYSLFSREWKTSEKIMEEYLPIVKKFGDPIFTLTAEVYYYIAKAYQGDQTAFHMAIKLFNVCFDVGFKAFAVTLAHFFAELYYQAGDHESTLIWINKILDHTEKSGSNLNKAELLRIKGLALQALNKPDKLVEEHYMQAIEISRKQKAKIFELRAAKTLSSLWKKQGKAREAYELLREVYDWFKEGNDSIDLMEAKKILKALKS
jgi:class 3 adenylate cyclase/tetratricopeptide (TPR) repeat protein